MTLYVTSPNFNVLIVIINFLLAKNHRENILQRTIPQVWGKKPLKSFFYIICSCIFVNWFQQKKLRCMKSTLIEHFKYALRISHSHCYSDYNKQGLLKVGSLPHPTLLCRFLLVYDITDFVSSLCVLKLQPALSILASHCSWWFSLL